MAISSKELLNKTLGQQWYRDSVLDSIRGTSPTFAIVDELSDVSLSSKIETFKITSGAKSSLGNLATSTTQATSSAENLREQLLDMIELSRVYPDHGASVEHHFRKQMIEVAKKEERDKEREELEKIPGFGVF